MPCHHIFATNSLTKIDVPKQYLRICWNDSNINQNKPNHCEIEIVKLKTKVPDLKQLVKTLCSLDNTLTFQNELSNKIIEYLQYNKNEWNLTKQMGSGCPGKRKYSKNCEKQIKVKKEK